MATNGVIFSIGLLLGMHRSVTDQSAPGDEQKPDFN
jgi:hypothetical protein